MGIVIAGVFIIATFLVASVLLFGTSLTTSVTQAQSLKQLADVNQERLSSAIDITSTTAANSLLPPLVTDVTVVVKNTGAQSIVTFSQMDVIMQYTDTPGSLVVTRLTYTSANPPGDNQWTKDTISPDSFNPGIWDPDETLTIKLRLVPQMKASTTGTVVIATPRGVNDQASVTN